MSTKLRQASQLNAALERLLGWRELLPDWLTTTREDSSTESICRMIDDCLNASTGPDARAKAAKLGFLYLSLDDTQKQHFLTTLTTHYGVNPNTLKAAYTNYETNPSAQHYVELAQALKPARIDVLKRFNALPDGFKFLVELRADLLTFLNETPDLNALEYDLRRLLESWFDVGLLTFEAITWDSPASLLEQLVLYEAVHKIGSWQDLKNRLQADRRVYAFFHPKMPGVPLIFVEVALTSGLATNIQALLDERTAVLAPAQADTAVFYSISNTQKGLRSISFGSFLLKRVMEDLQHQLPNLRTFVTLSPLPGFARWVRQEWQQHPGLQTSALQGLKILLNPKNPKPITQARKEAADKPLHMLAAYYLLYVQTEQGVPKDPVARFHLSNGARVEHINTFADNSSSGLEQSFGVMVNYAYETDADKLSRYQAALAAGQVPASASVKRLADAYKKLRSDAALTDAPA